MQTSYLFDSDGRYYEGMDTALYFAKATDETSFAELLRQANGSFRAQIKLGDTIYAAVDRYRSTPLFFLPDDDSG